LPIYKPIANGAAPTRNKNPEAEMNLSLSRPLAIRYMATGGDHIELSPPKIPEIIPKIICKKFPSLTFNFIPTKPFNAYMTIAVPIEIVSNSVGYEDINNEVINILINIIIPISQ
jgi:hypothetical protein